MLLATVTLLVVQTVAEVPTVHVCKSEHEGDSIFESCFGWCSATQSADHCQWCKVCPVQSRAHPRLASAHSSSVVPLPSQCHGCSWCTSAVEEDRDASPALSFASSSTSEACISAIDGDVTYRDCQAFCTATESRTHCEMCKCKACSFCSSSCTSVFEDDSADTQCQARQ